MVLGLDREALEIVSNQIEVMVASFHQSIKA
jgi:hypothetical protein